MFSYSDVRFSGQATVEAAVLIPLVLMVLLLLIQPSILLYDRMVMNNAAAEGCRLLATRTAVSSTEVDPYEDYIRSRLGTIPDEDHFHMHQGECSWDIQLLGDETAQVVQVAIANKVKLLPLIDAAAQSLGLTDEDGCFEITAQASFSPRNDWVYANEAGSNPASWVAVWE